MSKVLSKSEYDVQGAPARESRWTDQGVKEVANATAAFFIGRRLIHKTARDQETLTKLIRDILLHPESVSTVEGRGDCVNNDRTITRVVGKVCGSTPEGAKVDFPLVGMKPDHVSPPIGSVSTM
jgi:hypothetical protein